MNFQQYWINMRHPRKCRFVGGIIFVLCALVLSWLFNTQSSPLYKYFLYHVTLPNFWAAINAIPYIFAILTASIFMSIGLPESTAGYIGLFLQWFLIGWFVSGLICNRIAAARKNT